MGFGLIALGFALSTAICAAGSELGGAVKNVIALGVGIAVGMGHGDNTRAMLITRGLAEMARLGTVLGGAQPCAGVGWRQSCAPFRWMS